MQGVLIDMSGQRFERLIVVERAADSPAQRARWVCRCDCGAVKIVGGQDLRRGKTRSCGCLMREMTVAKNRRHGLTDTAEYRAVADARSRCGNANVPSYKNYGGRGIEYRLPASLSDAAAALLVTIGPRPPGMSLDRIDNDGHYEIGNLRWATGSEQIRNSRRGRVRGQL